MPARHIDDTRVSAPTSLGGTLRSLWLLAGIAALPVVDVGSQTLDRSSDGKGVLEIVRRHAARSAGLGDGSSQQRFDGSPGCRLQRARAALFGSDGLLLDDVRRASFGRALEEDLLAIAHRFSAHRGEAFHLLAMVSFRAGRLHEAAARAARAALAVPGSSRYASNLAYFLQATGRRGDARLLYRFARSLDPDNTAVHLGLLSLAGDSPVQDLARVEALARDWARRERVPALREVAVALQTAIAALREEVEISDPASPPGRDAGAELEELKLLQKVLGRLSAPAVARVGRSETPETPEPTPGSVGEEEDR